MKPDPFNRPMKRATGVLIVGSLQFALSLGLALQCYPRQFDFTQQYLSELGSSVVLPEQIPFPQAWVFNASLAVFGAALASFFVTLTLATKDGRTELPVCGTCGTCASISLFFVGVISMDVSNDLHVMAMGSWLFFMLPMSFGWMAWLREWYPRAMIWRLVNCLLVIGVLAYVPAGVMGFSKVWQKVVVIAAFGWLMLMCGQISYVFWRGRAFEFQIYRFDKLYRELESRNKIRNRKAQ